MMTTKLLIFKIPMHFSLDDNLKYHTETSLVDLQVFLELFTIQVFMEGHHYNTLSCREYLLNLSLSDLRTKSDAWLSRHRYRGDSMTNLGRLTVTRNEVGAV